MDKLRKDIKSPLGRLEIWEKGLLLYGKRGCPKSRTASFLCSKSMENFIKIHLCIWLIC